MLLHHTLIEPAGPAPSAWMMVLHGIYGSGGNWRTFARHLVDRRPDWGCALVDLRMHGRSQGAAPPHTVATAAADVRQTAVALGGDGRTVRAIAGHSFGGKVTLAAVGPELVRGWILDASPSARPGALDEAGNTVARVLAALESLPPRMVSRDEFAARLAAAGVDPAVIAWLGLNLERAGDAWILRLEMPAVRALLADYYATDLWPVVEGPPCPLRFAVAGRDSALTAADRTRLAAAADSGVDLVVHELAEAGHWLHIDALDQLLDRVAADLPSDV
jgi:pimeloyl-ACP methyl ester carboxylesterase